MDRILVTGSDGFIGSHLVEHLLGRGHAVRALVYYTSAGTRGWLEGIDPALADGLEVVLGDVRDAALVDGAVAGCDAVLHLAALIGIPYSYVAPESYVQTNVMGTLHVLQAARRHGTARVIVTSTSEVYGSAQHVPIDESHPLVAQSPYAATKIAADQLALSFHRSFDTPVTVARPFNTYGPRQSTRAVIPTIITQVARGDRVIRLGSLSPTRDFSYVTDTAAAFLALCRTTEAIGETVNFGSGFEISVGEVAALVGEAMGVAIEVVEDPDRVRPPSSEVDRLFADTAKARAVLDWTAEYEGREGFLRGLQRTARWYADPANLAHFPQRGYAV